MFFLDVPVYCRWAVFIEIVKKNIIIIIVFHIDMYGYTYI